MEKTIKKVGLEKQDNNVNKVFENNKLVPRVRDGFSDRNGYRVIDKLIQKESFDDRIRNKLTNFYAYLLFEATYNYRYSSELFVDYIYMQIFIKKKSEIIRYDIAKDRILQSISEWNVYDLLSFIEATSSYILDTTDVDFCNIINKLFQSECVGYRFIDGIITDIVDKEQAEAIEDAANCSYSGVKESINNALESLYNREHPNYANSVKDSILAVEGICNIINGTKNETLGKAIKKIKSSGVNIHSALETAFGNLYGYSSDQNGIRHNGGIMENTTFEEAKYMLISCSAFVNYLIELYEKIK